MIINYTDSTFRTIVKLDGASFIYLFNFIKEFLSNARKSQENETVKNFYKYKDGKEYYIFNIKIIYEAFETTYFKNKNEIEDFIKYQSESLKPLVLFNRMLDGDYGNPIEFEVEMDFQYWKLLFDITNYLETMNDVECYPESNDWSPPDNFRDGTDDEKEIWESHGKG